MSSKQLYKVKLVAVTSDGRPVTAQNWEKRSKLIAATGQVQYDIVFPSDESPALVTEIGVYTLTKHPTQGYYRAICNGIKVQVTVKKMVGELRYWA